MQKNLDDRLISGLRQLSTEVPAPSVSAFALGDLIILRRRRRIVRRLGLVAVGTCLVIGGWVGYAGLPAGNHADNNLADPPDSGYKSLSPDEFRLANEIAHDRQGGVKGTFIGATAVAAEAGELPGAKDLDCPDGRLIRIRLVWDADASDVHGGPIGQAADGPRKAVLEYVVAGTGEVCGESALYRDAGAGENETLLYGSWPAPDAS